MRFMLLCAILAGPVTAQEIKVTVQEFRVTVQKPKIYVTVADSFPCPPCEKLKKDRADGKLNQFDFPRYSVNQDYHPPFKGLRSYPAIRFRDRSGSWKVVYGYDASVVQRLRVELIDPPVKKNSTIYGSIGTSHESRETLIRHLLNDGIHRGRYTLNQLNAMSDDQLDAAHDRDHGWRNNVDRQGRGS